MKLSHSITNYTLNQIRVVQTQIIKCINFDTLHHSLPHSILPGGSGMPHESGGRTARKIIFVFAKPRIQATNFSISIVLH